MSPKELEVAIKTEIDRYFSAGYPHRKRGNRADKVLVKISELLDLPEGAYICEGCKRICYRLGPWQDICRCGALAPEYA